jgi:hypothetical protein
MSKNYLKKKSPKHVCKFVFIENSFFNLITKLLRFLRNLLFQALKAVQKQIENNDLSGRFVMIIAVWAPTTTAMRSMRAPLGDAEVFFTKGF